MKLTQRHNMYETRFAQSVGNIQNKAKFFNTTRASLSKTQYRLPQLNKSFSSSTAKSTKQKLDENEERIQELTSNIMNLRLQTRESRRFANFLREDLGDRGLQQNKQKMKQKINNLDKFAKMVRTANEEKTERLKNDCQRLHDSSIRLKNLMEQINGRIDSIEFTMGIYSGKEKHKV